MENEKFANKDLLLATMVEFTNSSTLEMGVTLNVNGSVITGMMISYESYLKGNSDKLKGINEVADILSQYFEKTAIENKKHTSTTDEKQLPNMIHLKNARLIDGNNTMNLELWRGKLSSIDGFIIGSLSAD